MIIKHNIIKQLLIHSRPISSFPYVTDQNISKSGCCFFGFLVEMGQGGGGMVKC
jgi:hypothetical protein